jgi:iron complex outermembrane receptor protein
VPYLCPTNQILVILPTLKKKYILSISLLLIQIGIFAQKDTLKVLPNLEISSLRSSQYAIGQVKLEADKTTLSLLQHQNLQDWLQVATPLSLRSYGTGAATLSSRGTGSNHSALLWNGINIQNGLSGVIDLPTFEVGSGGKISVNMGASTALFGSGTMGATIILDNEKPLQNGLKSELNIGAGSFDYQQLSANFRYKKRFFAGETRFSRQAANNNFEFKNTAELGQPLQRAENAAFERFNITQHIFLDLSKNNFLKLHFWHSQNYREVMPTMTSQNEKAILRDTSTHVMAEWSNFFKNNILKARIAISDNNNRYNSKTIQNSQNRIQTLVNEAEINKEFSKKYQIRLAANYTREQSLSSNFDENKTRNRIAILANQTYVVKEKTRLAINLRQEITDAKAAPFTFSTGAEHPFIITQSMKIKLRAAFSRVYNLPALNDLYWKAIGNPKLLPEQGWSKEIGISTSGGNERQEWKTHLTFFHINLKNRILWLPEKGIFRPNNLNQMTSVGLEYLANYSYKTGFWTFSSNAQYQLAKATSNNSKKQLIYIPVHNTNLSFSAKYKKATLLWQQTASSRRFMTEDNDSWTKPFTLSNVSLMIGAKYKKTEAIFAFRVFNLFNSDYQVIQYYPNPRRNFKFDATLSF